MRLSHLLAAIALCAAAPAAANFVVPPGFQQLMAESNLVVIGTVTAVNPGGRDGWGSTATLNVHRTLKGAERQTLVVATDSRIAELNPHCCGLGATYIMFLRGPGNDQVFSSVWGLYGMVRIGVPASANSDMTPSFDQLMARSAMVAIGTVTGKRLEQSGRESWVTLSVAQVLKGTDMQTLTFSNDEELNPRCCRVGAAYVLFMQPDARDGRLISIWGANGIVRIAEPPSPPVRILPDDYERRD
jgi:hypothetical protein